MYSKFQFPKDSNMLLPSGLWTNSAKARPSMGVLPYLPLLMKMICAPLQVMREGREVNQQPQGALQEQASSSSPETFQETLGAEVSAACTGAAKPRVTRTARNAVCLTDREFRLIR